ncbi:MAG: hypothetical protein ACYC4U_18310, partial [Pirellulaceae bacterium]
MPLVLKAAAPSAEKVCGRTPELSLALVPELDSKKSECLSPPTSGESTAQVRQSVAWLHRALRLATVALADLPRPTIPAHGRRCESPSLHPAAFRPWPWSPSKGSSPATTNKLIALPIIRFALRANEQSPRLCFARVLA